MHHDTSLIQFSSDQDTRLYATKYKDLKTPLIVTFAIFLVASICYCIITPSMNRAQLGFNVLSAIGQAGPLTLLVALIQFTAPHAFLSTATGLGFSARAIGGAFGSAVLEAIINSKLASTYSKQVSKAAVNAGLEFSQLPSLLEALSTGAGFDGVDGLTPDILSAAINASEWAYTHAYRLAWASIVPFIVVALVCMTCLKGVKDLMTEKVEATVEHVVVAEKSAA